MKYTEVYSPKKPRSLQLRGSSQEQQEYLIDVISNLPDKEKQRVYQQLLLLVGDAK